MQTTKKNLILMIILGSVNIVATSSELNTEPSPSVSAYQEVASVLINQAFSSIKPSDGTFVSAQAAFEKFNKEKGTNRVLSTAEQFFPNEVEYYNAIGAYAESQKCLFLAALFYNQANEYDLMNKVDLSDRVRTLGVLTVVNMLDKLAIQDGFIQNPRELFTKKDNKTGKTCLEQANDVFKLVAPGFKHRAEFVNEIYEHQKKAGKPSNVPQMFGDFFVNAK